MIWASLLAGCALAAAQPALAEHTVTPQSREDALTDTIIITAPRQIALPADAAAIAARVAGGDIFGNGALSGQLSYRGLAGERVLGRVNGQRFASGGPNAMDPPLHYAPSILVDRIDIARGVAPVAEGPSLGGAINAELVQAQFTDGDALTPQMRMASQYRSVDDSYAVGGLAALANQRWRFGLIASREQGEDYRFARGRAVGTSFERSLYGVHAGFYTALGELFVEYRRSETDPSGNPPFALDTVYFNTDFVQGGFRGEVADNVGLTLRIGHVAVRHLMDNQTLRQPAATPPQARATFAEADPTPLRFRNADAKLYGADIDFVVRPARHIELAGTASLVRGQRRDVADNLYRIPPANLRLSATWANDRLALGAELFAAADQNRVSHTNSEARGDRYTTVGLFARLTLNDALAIEGGVENLLDERYAAHLAGRSRVGASDVPIGERLPGPGRGGWLRLTARF